MNGLTFFDTNILIYMHDRGATYKREIALGLFRRHLYSRTLVLSTQVLEELYVNLTRNTANMRSPRVRDLITEYARLNIVAIRPSHVLDAIEVHARYRLSFWDGLILATARAAGASLVLSEDFGHGRVYDGVRVANPFATH